MYSSLCWIGEAANNFNVEIIARNNPYRHKSAHHQKKANQFYQPLAPPCGSRRGHWGTLFESAKF